MRGSDFLFKVRYLDKNIENQSTVGRRQLAVNSQQSAVSSRQSPDSIVTPSGVEGVTPSIAEGRQLAVTSI